MASKLNQNVLLITSDQWRGDCLSALGHPCIKTPNYDRLIEDGITFRNHYSVCAPCGPARASLLTGMYMQNHRSVRNGTPLDDRHTNIAREVRCAGYCPTLFGYSDTTLDPRIYSEADVLAHGYENLLPGFEKGLFLPAEKPRKWLKYLRSKGYDVSDIDTAYRQVDGYPGSDVRGRTYSPPCYSAEHSQTAFLTRRAIDYIGECENSWFVHLSYLEPHPPFIAPEPYNDMYDPESVPMPERADAPSEQSEKHPWLASALGPLGDWFDPWMREMLDSEHYDLEMRQIRATYYGLISMVDYYVGELIGFLKDTHKYENTLIVLTSDHGELLGDQWLFGKRGYIDSGYKIPLILRVPEQLKQTRGHVSDVFTESIDVMPTILDWLGVKIPRQCDGHSLLPFVFGDKLGDWRTEVHWEYDFRDVTDDRLERELGITMDECQLNVIRDSCYKYVHFTALPPLFFDLKNDPAEHRNLADDPHYAMTILDFSQKMLSWRMLNDERILTGIDVSRERIYSRK